MTDPPTKVNVRATVQSVFDRLKQQISESARNALLNDLALLLTDMEPTERDLSVWDSGYATAVAQLRAWMVSQSATGDHTP